MADAAYARPAPFGAESLSGAVRLFNRALRDLRARWAARAARRELSRLSPRLLADIGLADATLSRADLGAVSDALARR